MKNLKYLEKMPTLQNKTIDNYTDDWFEDLAYVFINVESCDELEEIWDDSWPMCPLCGAMPNENGLIKHNKQ
jgi:hypothetical protein